MLNYNLEFILNTGNPCLPEIENSLKELGDGLKISSLDEALDKAGEGSVYKILIRTLDPTLVFDLCSQFGRISSVKINEEGG